MTTTEDRATPPVGTRPAHLAGMAMDLAQQVSLIGTLRAVMSLARSSDICDAVGVLLGSGDPVVTVASSEPAVERADELQLRFSEGPSLEALGSSRPVVVDDLRLDGRWRFWGPTAAALGWRSVLSVPLAHHEVFGAVTLFSRRPVFSDPKERSQAITFARHVSLAVALARTRELERTNAEKRNLIGQAQGIMMERFGFDGDQSFTVLGHYASYLHQDVSEVALDILTSRRMPQVPA